MNKKRLIFEKKDSLVIVFVDDLVMIETGIDSVEGYFIELSFAQGVKRLLYPDTKKGQDSLLEDILQLIDDPEIHTIKYKNPYEKQTK